MKHVVKDEIVEKTANIFCNLFQLAGCLERDKVEAMGITRLQSYAIMHLFHEGHGSLQDLARSQHLASCTMSRVMDKLVDRGLVERDFDRKDRRRMQFKLSRDGQLLAGNVHSCYEEFYSKLINTIPVEDRERFLRNLCNLCEKMQETYMEQCQCYNTPT